MKNITRNAVLAVLAILTASACAQEKSHVRHYLSISHEVADYTTWKIGFDEHVSARLEAGLKDVFVKKDINNTNSITVFLEVDDLDKARAFVSSPKLKEVMAKAGVVSVPDIVFYKSATEFEAINTSALVTTITHSVKDFSAWKVVYDSAQELRANSGLNDHFILTSLSNENVVTVLGTSSSAARFNEFMSNPDLKAAMEKAGVISKPEVKVLL